MISEVDKNNNLLGLRSREDFYSGKHIHRASHLLLFNSQDKLLLQKRSMSKRWYPGLYGYSVSGTVGDESTGECMKREMKEEIGVAAPFSELFTFYLADEVDNAFATIYIARSDSEIKIEKGEVESCKWVSLEELKNDLEQNPNVYMPTTRKGVKIYFDRYGTGVVI